MNATLVETISEKTFLWRALLYLVHPNETRPKSLDEAPDYVAEIIPYFFVIMMLEDRNWTLYFTFQMRP